MKVDLLDLRGLSEDEQLEAMIEQYQNALGIWSKYKDGSVDPRLIVKFQILLKFFQELQSFRHEDREATF